MASSSSSSLFSLLLQRGRKLMHAAMKKQQVHCSILTLALASSRSSRYERLLS